MQLNHCYQGDCRDVMRQLIADGIRVQCIVTSPPYWGLRDYGHPGQLGQEPTLPEFLANMVEVFELCRQLLADEGTLWLNMGDSYANDVKWGGRTGGKHAAALHASPVGRNKRYTGLKPKDLVGQPWRLAFALQEAGWWLRQDIIWHKPNPMPESVRDRCTKAHEYLFLLTKGERYFFDQDAILEPVSPNTHARLAQNVQEQIGSARANGGAKTNGNMKAVGRKVATSGDAAMAIMPTERNRRSVWTIPTQSYSGAHFATFPEALVEPCILAGSRPGDIVFDPFMGSGTVASVAQRLGRNWLGSELNPDYINLQADRTRQQGLLLAAG
ncbi:DNA modification methylase [Chromobacterium vaccinii]|nr:DNA modification methylase [Chromobacterium vaccinii]QND89784.1 DNA modification methylase [Chromobacterium vaccinii]